MIKLLNNKKLILISSLFYCQSALALLAEVQVIPTPLDSPAVAVDSDLATPDKGKTTGTKDKLNMGHAIVDYVQEEYAHDHGSVARDVLEELVRQYIPEALYEKGVLLLNGCYSDGVRNPREATIYFAKAAAKGYVPAITALADSFLNGDGAQKSQKEAFRLYKMAADFGDGVAQFNLGVLYRDGVGVKQSRKMALYYLKKASQNKALGELQEDALALHDNLLHNRKDANMRKEKADE